MSTTAGSYCGSLRAVFLIFVLEYILFTKCCEYRVRKTGRHGVCAPKEKSVTGMSNKVKGILCIIASAFFFSLMSLFVRLSGDLPTIQKAFFRNAIAAAVAVTILARTPEGFYIRKESWPDLIRRSLYGTMGVLFNFWAIDHISIADASVLNKMSPFFAIILSAIILKEKAKKRDWVIVGIAFAGAVLVIKPTAGIASLPSLIGLLSGFGAGAAYTYVRKLGMSGERGPVIIMVFSLFSCIVCLPFMIADLHPMSVSQLMILLCAGMAAAGGQLTITAAYTFAPAKEISVFDYTNVLFTSAWGMIAFSEIPDALSVCGYIIIISMAVLKWHYSLERPQK